MGLNAPSGVELAASVVSGTFGATGNSSALMFYGPFNISLWGTFAATVILERSFDGGTTFLPCAIDTAGDANSYSVPMSIVNNEPEPGVYYRLRCSAYTSGTVSYRMSTGPRLT